MRKCIFLLSIGFSFVGCDQNPKDQLGETQYEKYKMMLTPYVNKKPDAISFEQRFDVDQRPYYKELNIHTGAEISHFQESDTAKFFFYQSKDLTSLYEHYRGLGGYFKTNEADSIIFVNLLYHTPRLTRAEMDKRSCELFKEMIRKGNVDKFLGDKKYVHTPNADFEYDTRTNRWVYTENSSWKFLEDAKQEVVK